MRRFTFIMPNDLFEVFCQHLEELERRERRAVSASALMRHILVNYLRDSGVPVEHPRLQWGGKRKGVDRVDS